jgi:hypothetical protein
MIFGLIKSAEPTSKDFWKNSDSMHGSSNCHRGGRGKMNGDSMHGRCSLVIQCMPIAKKWHREFGWGRSVVESKSDWVLSMFDLEPSEIPAIDIIDIRKRLFHKLAQPGSVNDIDSYLS